MNGGKDKFFIETPEQLEKIKLFYSHYKNDNYLSQAFQFCIFQKFIETPTDSKTYMRVLMSASGDVLGASLKYSKPQGTKQRSFQGMLEPYFFNEKSPCFLNCTGMFNYYSGGGNISFCQPRYSFEKQEMLEAHGIDPENPILPEDVLEVSQNITMKANKELGIMSGIDFIYNVKDQKWYYLEVQAFPAINEWAETKGIRKLNEPGIKGYVNY
ncbi:MAG: hypothetical protein IJA94_03905 [Bacilli bacterium]|nr:hypothetical protein [Bacilli bacterium]